MNHPFHVSGIHFPKIKTKPLLHMNKEVKVESVRERLKKSDFYHLGGKGNKISQQNKARGSNEE